MAVKIFHATRPGTFIVPGAEWVPDGDADGGHEVSHAGNVVSTREHNGSSDSDFYAVIWDHAKEEPFEVMYDTTRFAGGGQAIIDADDATRAAYLAYRQEQRDRADEARAVAAAAVIRKGDHVMIAKGRKGRGEEGKVVWIGGDNYAPSWNPRTRVGVKVASGAVIFTAEGNVVKVLS